MKINTLLARTIVAQILLLQGLVSLSSPGYAQAERPPSTYHQYLYDSGWFENTNQRPEIVISFVVEIPDAAWLRLYFDDIILSGTEATGSGSTLRLTSLADGATQDLQSSHVVQWRGSSAYFNGDKVLVEVIAHPESGWNRVAMLGVDAGLAYSPAESICGPTDDRIPDSDPRVARLMPGGCTGWIINDCNRCMLSAGHCTDPGDLGLAEFNVPASQSDGTIVHPPPSHQYIVDQSSLQSQDLGVGDDWAYFGCFPNSNTGLSPGEAQGLAFDVASPPGQGSTIRVTGYGIDDTPLERNQTQQTHIGPLVSASGTMIFHEVDTMHGNSGSPVIWESTGLVVGIHTNGGCSSGTQNKATSLAHNLLQAALASPLGVCSGPCSMIEVIIDHDGDGTGNTLTNPSDIAVDAFGNTFVAAWSEEVVFKISPDGSVSVVIDSGGDGTGNNYLSWPEAVEVDSQGNLYVGSNGSASVFRVTPSGVIEQILDASGDGMGHTFSRPKDIAIDHQDNVYVCGWDSVFKVLVNGTVVNLMGSSGDGIGNYLDDASRIDVDDQGNVYVCGEDSDNAFKIYPNGNIEQIIDQTGTGNGEELNRPDGIAVDSTGNVYVAGSNPHYLFRITPSGQITVVMDDSGDGMGQEYKWPRDVEVGPFDEIVVCTDKDNVFKISPDGSLEVVLDLGGDGAGNAMEDPSGLAIDGLGRIYVAAENSHNAFLVGPPSPDQNPTPLIIDYCFCDNNPPCNNPGGPGQGCQNSSGQGGWVKAHGSTSVIADDLRFTAHNLIPYNSALLYAGTSAVNGGGGVAFGDGLRCAGGNVVRLGVRTVNAGGMAYWNQGLSMLGGWVPGDVRYFQVWYRDATGGPCGGVFNLTNGVEVTFTF